MNERPPEFNEFESYTLDKFKEEYREAVRQLEREHGALITLDSRGEQGLEDRLKALTPRLVDVEQNLNLIRRRLEKLREECLRVYKVDLEYWYQHDPRLEE